MLFSLLPQCIETLSGFNVKGKVGLEFRLAGFVTVGVPLTFVEIWNVLLEED